MIPVAAPARVVARLAVAPDGPVELVHRGADAVYAALGEGRDRWCVGLLGRHAVPVPCGLRSLSDALAVNAAAVERGALVVDDEPVVVGRLVDVRVPPIATAVGAPAPPPGEVAAMVGRGDGLTPYEDDVLCGWLAAHRAAGVATPEVDAAVRSHLHRTTLLSATLLDCALHGEVLPAYAAWLAAVGTPAEPGAAAGLTAVGHSSGRGLLAGGRLALAHLRPLEGAA